MDFLAMDRRQLTQRADDARNRYADLKARPLSVDISRGKPSPEQLDLSLGLLNCLAPDDYRAADGIDCRNYGPVEGLPEARRMFAPLLEVDPAEVLVGGNSSLTLMYIAIIDALLRGVPGGAAPWRNEPVVKFLCPTPGYDRHFTICEHLQIQMVTVPMDGEGPVMDEVEPLVAQDAAIKGIWCVPKYSNPTGVTFTDRVVQRLAAMRTAAPDFRIFWDNAYTVHHLTDTPDRLSNLLSACKKAGNPDRVLQFASTSKVSFAGAGVAMIGASEANIRYLRQSLSIQTIGPDKLNQLRHVRFFKDMDGITAHMKRHAKILKPKFDALHTVLGSELSGKNIAQWSRPNGGYFISLDTLDGCATAIVTFAAEAGVKLTPAGATFPYGTDPRDRNVRLAPSMLAVDDIHHAMELVAVCVELASAEKLLGKQG